MNERLARLRKELRIDEHIDLEKRRCRVTMVRSTEHNGVEAQRKHEENNKQEAKRIRSARESLKKQRQRIHRHECIRKKKLVRYECHEVVPSPSPSLSPSPSPSKYVLYRAIQVMQAQSASRVRHSKTMFDDSSTANHGLLSEIALCEAHQRLQLNEICAERELIEKRVNIKAMKHARTRLLKQKTQAVLQVMIHDS